MKNRSEKMTDKKESDKLLDMESDYCLAMTRLIFPEAKTCAEGSKLMAKQYGIGLEGAIVGKNANLVNEPSIKKEAKPEEVKPVILSPEQIKANVEKGLGEFLGIEPKSEQATKVKVKPEPEAKPEVETKPKVEAKLKAEAKPKAEVKVEA